MNFANSPPTPLNFPMNKLLLLAALLISCAPAHSEPRPDFVWSGGVTAHSATVKGRLASDGPVRFTLSRDPDFSEPLKIETTLGPASGAGVREIVIPAGLEPATPYHYALASESDPAQRLTGSFRTMPEGAASFRFAFGSCARTGSNSPIFNEILATKPLFLLHGGDLHYLDIGENDTDLFRAGYDTVLASPAQSALFRKIPIVHMWDDHDFGPNDSDSTSPSRSASRATFREYVPHHPLADEGADAPIHRAFSVGRVRFILTDLRSERIPGKTMLGDRQKAWFFNELRESSKTHPLIVWYSSVPWINEEIGDSWGGYKEERREIADFIKKQNITGLCILAGDGHMLAIDDGSHTGYATGGGGPPIPLMHGGAFDQAGSSKGGPYSEGLFPGGGQFGLMDVTDSGKEIEVLWSGRRGKEEIVSHRFSVPALLPEK